MRRQDETRRHDAPDNHREAANDVVPGTDRRSPLHGQDRLLDLLSLDLCGTDRRADERAPPEEQAPNTFGDTRDVRAPGARNGRLRTREIEGVRRDVRRGQEPILPRPADRDRAAVSMKGQSTRSTAPSRRAR